MQQKSWSSAYLVEQPVYYNVTRMHARVRSVFAQDLRPNRLHRYAEKHMALTSIRMFCVEFLPPSHLGVEEAGHQLVHDVLQRLVGPA